MATPLQIETLKAIQDGRVTMANCGHSAWRIFGASPSVVGRLIAAGLAAWPLGQCHAQTCQITDAGRAVIASQTHLI